MDNVKDRLLKNFNGKIKTEGRVSNKFQSPTPYVLTKPY
jgi:hypothetical protein